MSKYQKVSAVVDQDEEEASDTKNGRVLLSEEKTALMSKPADRTPPERRVFISTSNFLKLTILVAVTLQNTGYALIRRYSRGHLKEKYSTSSALLTMELAKLALSMGQVAYGGHESDVPAGSALSKFSFLIAHSWKMMVPAVIYLIMNILGFLALSHLDASTFSIVAQMKVFTTAIFSVLILGRQLHMRKWRALTTLTLGVILISNEALPRAAAADASQEALRTHNADLRHFAIGMGASLGDVLLSGFASIYFEMVLKSKSETYSVWDRNLQLAFWSSLIYGPIMMYDNPSAPFQGWSIITMACSAVGALGGVLVALSIKHTDSIMKTIATTGAIVLTTILNAAFLNGPFTLPIWTGALIVVISVFNYNDRGDPEAS
uniref:UDP-galactose transporter n=1 Tax=Haptolina brevifila TaxID=156173 RepID=A0A7S2JMY7_9EUKA|mmetsp:Transcript_85962/g.171652  ORF Transcript_85962/g.171652 Transcript_85962/m.171652 type:complete len:377 (+) Transcript_85962:98-1228(+)